MSGRRPSSLRADLGANVVAQVAAAAVPLVGVPVLLRVFGLGAFGFIGLLSSLAVSLTVLTRGLGWALQREVAASWGTLSAREEIARSARTYEVLSWAVGVALAVAVAASSPGIASAFASSSLGQTTLQSGFALLGLKVAALPGFATYQAVLFGAGAQVRANAVMTLGLVLSAAAALGAAVVTESLIMYLLIDTTGWLVTTAVLGREAHRVLPAREGGRRWLGRSEIRSRSGLAGGLVLAHGSGLIIGQADRLAVSVLRPLDALGAYTPASTAARALSLTYAPLLAATYPRLCRLAAEEAHDALRQTMRMTTALTAWACGCAASVLIFFASDVLSLWTGQSAVAERASTALAVCAVAGILLGQVDSFLQLHSAWGTSKVAVRTNIAALVWSPPATLALVHYAGITGAALGWLAYTAVSWVVFLVATERRLPGAASVHLRSLLPPLLIAGVCSAASRVTVDVLGLGDWTRLIAGFVLALLLTGTACMFALGWARGVRALLAGEGIR